jgi:sugar (pentulose or hexulose) kinase
MFGVHSKVDRELDRAPSFIDPGCHGPKFLPNLSGQLAPERKVGASTTFHVLNINQTRNEMFRLVLEGSGFALWRGFNRVVDCLGEPASIGESGSSKAPLY